MKINLLDAGLAEKGGHHFEHDRKLAETFVAAGHQVHIYSADRLDGATERELAAICPVSPVLRAWQYASAGMTEDAQFLALFNRQSKQLGEDLRAVEAADLWLWPTALPQQVHACVRVGVDAPIVGCLHEDRGIARRATAAMLWPVVLAEARKRGLHVALGSIEPELCARFAPLFPCAQFPQPYDGPPPAAPRTALARVGLFGHQRPEKGVDLIAPLVERLAPLGFEIVVHDSRGGQVGAFGPGVETLGYLEDMAGALAACDLVVLPYNPARYAWMGSGILAECRSLGVPVAVTAGTIPGNLVQRLDVGPLFDSATPEAIVEAVRQAARDYRRYSEAAFREARDFASRNGAARFAEAMLSAA